MTDSAAGSEALAVEYRMVGSLKPDPRNARTHPKRQLEQIKASIEEFGFTNPILIDEQSAIIAGHGRLRAAKEAGLEEVPTIVLAGLSDGQKRVLRLADNKIALGASWDLDLLGRARARSRGWPASSGGTSSCRFRGLRASRR